MRINENKLRRIIREILVEAQTFNISGDDWNWSRDGRSFDENESHNIAKKQKEIKSILNALLSMRDYVRKIYPNESDDLLRLLVKMSKSSNNKKSDTSKFVEPDDERTGKFSASMFKDL